MRTILLTLLTTMALMGCVNRARVRPTTPPYSDTPITKKTVDHAWASQFEVRPKGQ